MLKKVYIETSVVGAYFDERTDVVSVAQRYWTRLGLYVPDLVTPNQLTGDPHD